MDFNQLHDRIIATMNKKQNFNLSTQKYKNNGGQCGLTDPVVDQTFIDSDTHRMILMRIRTCHITTTNLYYILFFLNVQIKKFFDIFILCIYTNLISVSVSNKSTNFIHWFLFIMKHIINKCISQRMSITIEVFQ